MKPECPSKNPPIQLKCGFSGWRLLLLGFALLSLGVFVFACWFGNVYLSKKYSYEDEQTNLVNQQTTFENKIALDDAERHFQQELKDSIAQASEEPALPGEPVLKENPEIKKTTPVPFSAERQEWQRELKEVRNQISSLSAHHSKTPFSDFFFALPALDQSVPITLICLVLILIGFRFNIVSVRTALMTDRRSPILYLRSFEHDRMDFTIEPVIVRRLKTLGPVIAIGKPGEKLPPIGAARFYASNEDWQRAVEVIIPHCRAIFVRAGKTRGLQWELNHLRHECHPDRLVVYFPLSPGSSDYPCLRRTIEDGLRIVLPEEAPEVRKILESTSRKSFADIQFSNHFVVFDSAWRPALLNDDGAALAQRLATVDIPDSAQESWHTLARTLRLIR